jgi:SAM-dependent methyltransferase
MPILCDLINLYDQTIDSYWDRKLKINTRDIVETYDLLPEKIDHLKNAKKYQPVRTRVLQKALNQFIKIETPAKFHFVDLGAGKGRTCYWANEFQFKSYVGVDFSKLLIKEAQKNYQFLNFGDFILQDVIDLQIQDQPTVYFMFNPFDGFVLRKFLNKFNSIKSDTYFIYVNPVLNYVFDMYVGYQLIYKSKELNHNNHIYIYKKN